MKKIFLCLCLLPFTTFAKNIRIVQADKTFFSDITDQQASAIYDDPSIEEKHKIESLEASVGDTLMFANRDEVSHNVSGSIAEKAVFDVKLQPPGAPNDRKIELTSKGEYVIQCAIHPKMKVKIKVN